MCDKNFIGKGYQTEADRVQRSETLNQEFGFGPDEYNTSAVLNYDYRPDIKSETFQQPNMRFKDKTAIERLVIKLQHQKQVAMMKSKKGGNRKATKRMKWAQYKEK